MVVLAVYFDFNKTWLTSFFLKKHMDFGMEILGGF